jgi:exopolysaccharide/PEP-CTERM locus tyrosine autokinase
MSRNTKDGSSIEKWYSRNAEASSNKQKSGVDVRQPPEPGGVASSGSSRPSDFMSAGFDAINNSNPDIRSTGNKREENRVEIHARLKASDMLVEGSRLGAEFADEYRRIKRPLLSNAFGKSSALSERANLILLASSIPNEGKTYTAINLALSIAQERDHSVLLVDCDMAKKGVSRILGLEDTLGLVDVLESDHVTLGEAILKTDIPGLSVLPAGIRNDYGTELYGSHRMSSLIDEMVSRYEDRVIVFDGPPIIPTPQAQVLAGLVGQIVFVIQAAKTPQQLVVEALDMLPKDKTIGLMMNKGEQFSGRKNNYYGYYGSDE